MRMSALVLLAIFGIGGGTAAAADLIVDDPEAIAAAADYDWSGTYAGLFGGGGNGEITLEEPSTSIGWAPSPAASATRPTRCCSMPRAGWRPAG